jgi:hypothetical protein
MNHYEAQGSRSSGSDRAKFDIDLQYGQAGENWLTWLGTDQAKVEVKTERDTWATTGNAVFEYECRGRKSGIAVTTADFWVHVFRLGDVPAMAIVLPTEDLKDYLRAVHANPAAYGCRLVSGGDDSAAKVILVPIPNLWQIACRTLPFATRGQTTSGT